MADPTGEADPLAVMQQIIDKIEDLGFDGDQRTRPAQLAAVRIEREIFKLKRQGRAGKGSRR
jgi:hypothetical protein